MESKRFLKVFGRVWAILLTLLLVSSALPVTASTLPDAAASQPAGIAVPLAMSPPENAARVTLITGDTVNVVTVDGVKNLSISPARPDKPGQHYTAVENEGSTYVIPGGVDLEKLDLELFNIDYLMNEQYNERADLPLLVTYRAGTGGSSLHQMESKFGALGLQASQLHQEISAISARLSYQAAPVAFGSLMAQTQLKKIWLDKKVHASLDESVPVIGADAWQETGYDGEGVTIAILDTGIDKTHPALDDLDDDDETTDPKVVREVNFTDDADTADHHGHGTHVSGIAAGTAAGTPYEGVAPGATLWNVKVLNRYGYGYDSWVIDGLNYASLGADGLPGTDDEADIINMSLGSASLGDGSDPLSQAVNEAVDRGVVVVVVAGNGGPERFTIMTPGLAEKAITVGASDAADALADYSSCGPTTDFRIKPDILAPGSDIHSCVPGGGYTDKTGTSMAAPHVSGAAALLLDRIDGVVPAGLSRPRFVKDALMSSARDIGEGILEQGSGRLDLNNCWGSDSTAGTDMLVSPASVDLGHFETNDETASGSLTFISGPEAHEISLVAEFVDLFNGDDYSGSVNLSTGAFSIAASATQEIEIEVDITELPPTFYGGKITAVIDGDSQRTVHAIFSLVKSSALTVHKIDINGDPAQGHQVWALEQEGSSLVVVSDLTDASGNVTFNAFGNNAQIISLSYDDATQQAIWTVAEDVPVSGDATISLDERDTVVIDFNPNEAGQVASAKAMIMAYASGRWHEFWSTIFWYPETYTFRCSPISAFDAFINYQFYPEADFVSGNPALINTAVWHNLGYNLDEITADTMLVADYDNLVHRHSSYQVALEAQDMSWLQFAHYEKDGDYYAISYLYAMDSPLERWEWLSPDPVVYAEGFGESSGAWEFDSDLRGFAPGALDWAIGAQPLVSGVDLDISGEGETQTLEIEGAFFLDRFENILIDNEAPSPGLLTILKDGVPYASEESWDGFIWTTDFSGTPSFTAYISGTSSLTLSRQTLMQIEFAGDAGRDYRPPKLSVDVPGINGYGIVSAGDITVAVEVVDDSPVDNVTLLYSLNDGIDWVSPGLPAVDGNRYLFDLGEIAGSFVSVNMTARDSLDNHTSQTTERAFYVSEAEPVAPGVTTGGSDNVTTTSARLYGTLDDTGTAPSVNVSFEWAATSGGPYVGTVSAALSGAGDFSAVLSGLDPHTPYYFRAKAAGDGTAYGEEMEFRTGNTPPVLASGSVDPAAGDATTGFAYAVTYTDADNDAPASINVSIDGAPPAAMTAADPGDSDYTDGRAYRFTTSGLDLGSHTFQFTAGDGFDAASGDTGEHSGPDIGNASPTGPTVQISPAQPLTANELTCSVTGPSADADGDNVTYTYHWYKNDALQGALTSASVDASYTSRGEVWKCLVVPNDGQDDGPTAQDEVTIDNTPPTAPVIALTPDSPTAGDDLVCTITTGSTDEDSDNVTYTYRWYKNGVLQPALTTDTVDFSNISQGETWRCEVIPSDGSVDGPSAYAEVTVQRQVTVNGGGGGSGGGGGGPSGLIRLADVITGEGKIVIDFSGQSADLRIKLMIKKGVYAMNKIGERLLWIRISEMDDPPPPPGDANIIGLPYTFEPSGATFDPAITIVFKYDPDDLPEGFNEADLSVAFYDTETGEWIVLENITVDPVNHTVSGDISHFTKIACIAYPPPPPPVTTTAPAVTTTTPAAPPSTPAPATTPAPAMATTQPPTPASFSVADLSVTPTVAAPLEEVMVKAVIENSGGQAGVCPVELDVDGRHEAFKEVSIEAGEEAAVTFSLVKETAGTYTLSVNGRSARFTLAAPPADAQQETRNTRSGMSPYLWWIIGAAVVLLIAAMCAATIVRRI